MVLADRIKEARKAAGLTQKELGERMGVSDASIAQYESGQRNPKINTLQRIAEALDDSFGDLLGIAALIDGIYSKEELERYEVGTQLTPTAQRVARAYDKATLPVKKTVEVALEPFMEAAAEFVPEIETVELREYDEPAAAGYGNYLTNDGYKIRTFLKNEVPHGTDFCVRLDGDSMEPDYPNGSTVYVKAADAVDAGQIGIFMTDADGKAYCKKLIVDHHNRQTRLVSLNPEYEDIVITPDDDLRTVGRVLGVVREDKYK